MRNIRLSQLPSKENLATDVLPCKDLREYLQLKFKIYAENVYEDIMCVPWTAENFDDMMELYQRRLTAWRALLKELRRSGHRLAVELAKKMRETLDAEVKRGFCQDVASPMASEALSDAAGQGIIDEDSQRHTGESVLSVSALSMAAPLAAAKRFAR